MLVTNTSTFATTLFVKPLRIKEVALAYCPTTDQVADILTKPLLRVLFQKFRSLTGIC